MVTTPQAQPLTELPQFFLLTNEHVVTNHGSLLEQNLPRLWGGHK